MNAAQTAEFIAAQWRANKHDGNTSHGEDPDEEVVKLFSEWSYDFREWVQTGGFVPVALLESKDHSAPYEMDRCHIFELVSGYAVVLEQGCSCYDSSWAQIDIVGSLNDAKAKFGEWDRGRR